MAETPAQKMLHALNVQIFEEEQRAQADCEEYKADAEASCRARMQRLSDELFYVRAQRDAIVKELAAVEAASPSRLTLYDTVGISPKSSSED